MSLCVSVDKVKRQPFLTLDDFHVINYQEIREWIIGRFAGVDELPEYPSMKEVRQYIDRFEDESKEQYYDRALREIPLLKREYNRFRFSSIMNVKSEEQEYLEDYHTYEEIFFRKRCYDLADILMDNFKKSFEGSGFLDVYFPIVLNKEQLEQFNQLAEQDIKYEEEYIYKLSVG